MPGFGGFELRLDQLNNCSPEIFNESPGTSTYRAALLRLNRENPEYDVETFRKYRYNTTIYNLELGGKTVSPTIYLESVGRPKLEFDKITIHHGQDEIYRPGKSRWAPIVMSFYEVVGASIGTGKNTYSWQVAESIYRWANNKLTRFGLQQETNPSNRYSSIQKASEFYKNVSIVVESGEGYKLREYFLYECWPSSITPSELSYSSNEIAKIELELTYNRADEMIFDGTQ